MNKISALVCAITFLVVALPAKAKETVFVPTEPACEIGSKFEIFDFRLGNLVSQVESRQDCTFHKELPGLLAPRRQGALSKEGEVVLTAVDPALHTVSDRDPSYWDCSHLQLNGQRPDVVYCFFEKEAESGMPVLNELFASFADPVQSSRIVQFLKMKYGPVQRKVLPNDTVEYQWRDSKGVLTLFVMLSSSCINLQTLEKREKSQQCFGDPLPGFSVECAKQFKKSGRSLMAESEKNNTDQD